MDSYFCPNACQLTFQGGIASVSSLQKSPNVQSELFQSVPSIVKPVSAILGRKETTARGLSCDKSWKLLNACKQWRLQLGQILSELDNLSLP